MSRRVWQCSSACVLMAALAGASLLAADDKSGSDSTQHFRAKQIIGSKVSIENNMAVGTVDDIVLDENGNVDYLIVLNSENTFVSVPWDAARFNVEKRLATVHITPERFKQVPTFTVDHYPVFSTPAYRIQTYKYYGLTPGQERRMIKRGTVVVPN